MPKFYIDASQHRHGHTDATARLDVAAVDAHLDVALTRNINTNTVNRTHRTSQLDVAAETRNCDKTIVCARYHARRHVLQRRPLKSSERWTFFAGKTCDLVDFTKGVGHRSLGHHSGDATQAIHWVSHHFFLVTGFTSPKL